MSGGEFWLAQGPCQACGRSVARRVEGPGRHHATCNVCRATTWVWARRMRAGRDGPEPVPLREGPGAPAPAAIPQLPTPSRGTARRFGWIAGAALAVLLVVGGVGLTALLPSLAGGDVEEASLPPAGAWRRVEGRLVVESVADAARVRFDVRAFDAAERDVPADGIEGLPIYNLSTADALVRPTEVAAWETCAADACDLQVARGRVVFLHPVAQPLAFFALDTRTGVMHAWNTTAAADAGATGEWRELAAWEEALAFTLVRDA